MKVQRKACSLGMKGGWEEGKVKSQVAPGRKGSVPRVRRHSVHTGTKYCSFLALETQFNEAPPCCPEGCLELSDIVAGQGQT